MIQVMNKAFRILEHISKEPERAHPLNELAELINASPAACSHLVKTLVSNAYLEQSEKRQGYKLGAMAYYLSRNGAYRQDLVNIIEPSLKELTGSTGETSSFSQLHNSKKHVLCTCKSANPIQLDDTLLYLDPIYQTATGRVLMAHSGRREQDLIIADHGLPGAAWDKISETQAFYKKLEALKNEDICIVEPQKDIVFMAVPIYMKDKIFGALALSIPSYRLTADRRYFFSSELLRIAEKIKNDIAGHV